MAGQSAVAVNEKIKSVVEALAPRISVLFQQSVANSGLRRISGKSARGFRHKIHFERATGEVWGLSFGTVRYVYMHHHGMDSKTVQRGKSNYTSRGYPSRAMLTQPAADGAKMLGDAIARAGADGFATMIRF